MISNDEIKLDASDFKALSSETRMNILKKLEDNRYTVTDLSKELDISKSTMHEHLSKLEKTGIVERDNNDNKWVYYELTKKGNRLLNPHDKTKLVLLISLAGATVVAGLHNVYTFVQRNYLLERHEVEVMDIAPEAADTTREIAGQTEIVTGLILLFAAAYFLYQIYGKYIK